MFSATLYGHAAVEQEPSAPQASGGGPLEIRATLSHSDYTTSTRLIVKVDCVCVAARKRSPLNIALVLDSSGSMAQDQKIKYTIEAARLEEVFPESYTDISAGLLERIAQIKSRSTEGQLRHVLLLTDGMANRGVTDHRSPPLSKKSWKACSRSRRRMCGLRPLSRAPA